MDNRTQVQRYQTRLHIQIQGQSQVNQKRIMKKEEPLVASWGSKRINESVVLEVGNLFFNVQIWEVGFSDNSFIPKDTDKRKECDYKPTSSSSSSSEANNNSRRYSIENIREVEEAINEENIGSLNVGDREVEVSKEFSSGKRVLIETNQIEKEGEKSKQQKQSWISVLLRNPGKEGGLETGSIKKDLEVENTDVDFVVNNQAQEVDKTCGFEKLEKTVSGTHKHEDSKGIQFERAFEDASNMGLASSPKKTNEKKGVESFSEPVCPERLSTKGGSENLAIEQDEWSGSSDGGQNYRNVERVFLPEFESRKYLKKRYGSLKCLQDFAISEKEKKKRDRAIRRDKKKSKEEAKSEVSGMAKDGVSRILSSKHGGESVPAASSIVLVCFDLHR
ncbi:hypothetical protein V6N12_047606 [Hibiscus sabdariffa]|uniref:Uncharacterized protein n=1 Tax=Hibiscus sabdariffa TaxID=183260 RepID=A0ABR2CTG6_9ROSI